jgi:hypothetical protein
MSSKTIVIERPSSGVNRNFPYLIVSDNGKVLTAIKNGQQGKVVLPANASYVQAKLMWCSSQKLNVTQLNDNATIELTQNNFLNARMPFVVSAFPLAFLLSGYGTTGKYIALTVLCAILVLLIATLTIWKDRWLKLVVK